MTDVLFTKLRWCVPILEHLHLARKRTVYCIYTVLIYCIYTVNEYRDDVGEKNVLDEWGKTTYSIWIYCIYTVYCTVYCILYIMYYISNIYSTVSRWPSRRRRSQNAEQLWENGLLRCRRKPQSFQTYDSSEFGVWSLRKSKVYVHDTTLRSQNAEQLRENGWLRCSRKPQSFKTYDSSESGVWSSYTVREAYKPLNLRKTTR